MKRREFLAVGAGTLVGNSLGMTKAFAQASRPDNSGKGRRKPNIIVIFTDDQGFADLGCQGQLDDIRTPNLDRMAAEGVRCTDAFPAGQVLTFAYTAQGAEEEGFVPMFKGKDLTGWEGKSGG